MNSPSPISSVVTRRAALLAAGAGAVVTLSACAQSVHPLSKSSF